MVIGDGMVMKFGNEQHRKKLGQQYKYHGTVTFVSLNITRHKLSHVHAMALNHTYLLTE